MSVTISEAVKYIGVDDKTIDLFESQYVVPHGVSYNSYLIFDEKVALMDTVDTRGVEQWEKNLLAALDGRNVDYLIVSHLEPDHAGSIGRLVELFPEVTLVGNAKTFQMLPQFFDELPVDENHKITVAEGESLSLGTHTLNFYMAPMVHWPEVMVTYESSEKILFSADGFGKFGALDYEDPDQDNAACLNLLHLFLQCLFLVICHGNQFLQLSGKFRQAFCTKMNILRRLDKGNILCTVTDQHGIHICFCCNQENFCQHICHFVRNAKQGQCTSQARAQCSCFNIGCHRLVVQRHTQGQHRVEDCLLIFPFMFISDQKILRLGTTERIIRFLLCVKNSGQVIFALCYFCRQAI